MMWRGVLAGDIPHIKKERECKPPARAEPSPSAGALELYEGHAVKEELVIGPEVLQRPATGTKKVLRVLLERLNLNQEHYHGSEPSSQYICKETANMTNKQVSCGTVDKKVSSKSASIPHRMIHTKDKSCTCNICKKDFSVRSRLNRHSCIHSGKEPFICYICNKTFREKPKLLHRPFACNVCDKKFTKKWTLSSHLRTHIAEQPYKCNTCDKKYSYKSMLMSHQRIHSREGPSACSFCDKTFTLKSSLTSHLRIHSGEKPYKCGTCGKKFTLKSELKCHLDVHSVVVKLFCPRAIGNNVGLEAPGGVYLSLMEHYP